MHTDNNAGNNNESRIQEKCHIHQLLQRKWEIYECCIHFNSWKTNQFILNLGSFYGEPRDAKDKPKPRVVCLCGGLLESTIGYSQICNSSLQWCRPAGLASQPRRGAGALDFKLQHLTRQNLSVSDITDPKSFRSVYVRHEIFLILLKSSKSYS